jgi:hypothetical protein
MREWDVFVTEKFLETSLARAMQLALSGTPAKDIAGYSS